MTFTKEQLQQIIDTEHVQCGDASALARLALAGMEAVPVAWLWSNRKHPSEATLVRPEDDERAEAAQWSGWSCQALYSAPQLPQPAQGDGRDQFEEWFKFHHGDEHSIIKLHRANGGANYRDPHVDLAWIAWKDSRAAMLQAKAAQTDYRAIVDRISEIVHGKVTDIDLLTVTVKSMKDKLSASSHPAMPAAPQQEADNG